MPSSRADQSAKPAGLPAAVVATPRPSVRGKSLALGDESVYVCGVTYGTFRPDENDVAFPPPDVVAADFQAMGAAGLNAVRTYTVPPEWLLDLAREHGLLVMVGIAWEQHVSFLDDPALARSIEEMVVSGVDACSGHPAVLCYAIGNEIPASIVRWHGHRKVERFLDRLLRGAKEADPGGLVTYVNYPSTEYLRTDAADICCFNVYLESVESFESYLLRLHNLAGDKPLLVAEMGLDSGTHGEALQAEVLETQLRTAFDSGVAGAFVFSWTDEWHRGGVDVEDWSFGLTTRDRRAKPALDAVSRSAADVPFPEDRIRPRISVVVCTHNGGRTIHECCDGLLKLRYPDFEVIVVDDGSTDASAAVAEEFGFRVVRTANEGLASARNTGLIAATGEIVAYLDDDARPDPHWLHYLAETFASGPYGGVGGPNLPCAEDGVVAHCVANSPGGPTHVLLSDTEAEHLPGCNMAFRRDALEAVGGFDPQFRVAGDDVDICWQLQRDGWLLGFSPAAVVWHHRRSTVRGYWKQQRGYGRAEALLERKWPAKYNAVGHLSWAGRLYGKGLVQEVGPGRRRIRYGIWGSGAFQSVADTAPRTLNALPGMPEWYLVLLALASLSAAGALWRPLILVLPFLAVAVSLLLCQAAAGAAHASFDDTTQRRVAQRLIVFGLYLAQPLARLYGRLGHGLTPWRHRGLHGFAVPLPRSRAVWTEVWSPPSTRLRVIGRTLITGGTPVLRGGDCDRWELEARPGPLGRARLRMALEEHGEGRQLARFRVWPRATILGVALPGIFFPLALVAALAGARTAAAILAFTGGCLLAGLLRDCSSATSAFLRGITTLDAAASETLAADQSASTVFDGDGPASVKHVGATSGGEAP